ncbi:phBC6A51 family helix-turn-helix protein [Salibacterium aidingense]|uniref:phBC6A51 family helix-turn-helix protein n=1 Tax=Salibacterium aidingense TaxID=384933 RepID=UPI003BE7BB26
MAKLSDRQHAAIAILAMPQRAGMTYEQVAEEVGVTRKTLHEWRKQDDFNDEMIRQVKRNAVEHLPDMYASIPKHVIEDGNAALFRSYIQSLGMLTEKHEIETKESGSSDIADIKAKIAQYKGEDGSAEE